MKLVVNKVSMVPSLQKDSFRFLQGSKVEFTVIVEDYHEESIKALVEGLREFKEKEKAVIFEKPTEVTHVGKIGKVNDSVKGLLFLDIEFEDDSFIQLLLTYPYWGLNIEFYPKL